MNSLGKGLTAIIFCETTSLNNWMSFATYYSLLKNLPDAKLAMYAKRAPVDHECFLWCRKADLKFRTYSTESNPAALAIQDGFNYPFLILRPDILVLDELSPKILKSFDINHGDSKLQIRVNGESIAPDLLYSSVKNQENSVFVDYSEGWGRFDPSRWLNKAYDPFRFTDKYITPSMTINELKTARLMKKMAMSYAALNK